MPVGADNAVASHAHVVHFYNGDEMLIDTAGPFLADALRDGGTAIVVATAGHRAAFATAMVAAGIDTAAAVASGRLVFEDAEATLALITKDGIPRGEAFDNAIGALVRGAAAAGGPVHVYGEMVAVLWDQGLVTSALALEEMWNSLGRTVSFSLFCAYPSEAVEAESHARALDALCRLHSAVVVVKDGHRARSFPASVHSVGAARRFVAATLERWGRPEAVADAVAIVSELATNALVHAGTAFEVEVSKRNGLCRLAVRDGSTELPVRRHAPASDPSGRGLLLVDAMAARWGVEQGRQDKVVWAELP